MVRTRLIPMLPGLVSVLLLINTPLQAQSMSEFEAFKRQYMGEFKQFKDEMDREFADFLKQRWKAFDSTKGVVRDEKPKPLEIPVARVKDPEPEPAPRPVTPVRPAPVKPVPVKPAPVQPVPLPPSVTRPQEIIKQPPGAVRPPVKPIPRPVPRPPEVVSKPPPLQPSPIKPVQRPPARPATPPPPVVTIPPPPPSEKTVKVEFLGYSLEIVDGVSAASGAMARRIDFTSIQQRFTDLAQADYPKTVKNLADIRQRLKLNDWAYVQLVQKFSKAVSGDKNSARLTSWFLLLKAGLDARVAYNANELFLMVAVEQKLYDIAYIQYNGQKYYSVSLEKRLPLQLYSYDGNYPKKLNRSDFSLAQSVQSKPDEHLKEFRFTYQRKTHSIKLPYNRHTVDFLSTYPQMDIDQYFQVPLNHQTADAMLSQLQPIVDGMSERDAVNLLLRFVQTAFKYKTDQDQFGAENYMFIEETIYYPASDCEDRSIFFAWLVKNLLGLEVVGLDFPGHIATAVLLNEPVGDTVVYKGRRFTVADPTYINANAGMKMPQFKNVAPGVIPVL
jgi:hypothetical protein